MDIINDFAPYVGLAVILYAIRQTSRVSNRYIPIVAIVLGVLYSFWESGVSPQTTLVGLKYALLGIGTVAGVKYFIESSAKK
ncbi:phage holin family protein [Fictibacillus enclensis]|uniref:phage holin family protein n=1 Tax=Fictibacillus enclensis TaxID=1017270 RepID=UPI0024C06984|nr:phage holin family protein [Fictibacillus enclensis]WHY72724.1 phage holin family protein [Fictibacillus enclensis]